ncbi:MAG: hypothetical protein KME42_12975 [Tildeniella nuda ZEHNDER 1965/U140]|nr:hypothetical protein [Tildeniella nuda ZEHNDER 1965/U140]
MYRNYSDASTIELDSGQRSAFNGQRSAVSIQHSAFSGQAIKLEDKT